MALLPTTQRAGKCPIGLAALSRHAKGSRSSITARAYGRRFPGHPIFAKRSDRSDDVVVGLVTRYSNRLDLLDDLERSARRLARALDADPIREPASVRSFGRVGGHWALTDRLSKDQISAIVEKFRAGTTKQALAMQYGISPKSVQRLIRRSEKRL